METLSKVGVIGLTGQSAFFSADHLPRPGETVSCPSLLLEPGGKGHNQAVACARLGAPTVFVGAAGRDAWAGECRRALEAQGVKTFLIEKDCPTAFAAVTTDEKGENTVAVCPGASAQMAPEDILSGPGRAALEGCKIFLLQNELPPNCLEAALDLAQEAGARVIFNPAPARRFLPGLLARCGLVTPNREEAKQMAGFLPGESPSDEELAAALRKAGVQRAAVTLGSGGALLVEETTCRRLPAYSAGPAVDTAGAGDTFNGALAAALARGEKLKEAARFAMVAAGLSVTKRGAAGSIPTLSEVMAIISTRRVENGPSHCGKGETER